jgi:hypothetical protein
MTEIVVKRTKVEDEDLTDNEKARMSKYLQRPAKKLAMHVRAR